MCRVYVLSPIDTPTHTHIRVCTRCRERKKRDFQERKREKDKRTKEIKEGRKGEKEGGMEGSRKGEKI